MIKVTNGNIIVGEVSYNIGEIINSLDSVEETRLISLGVAEAVVENIVPVIKASVKDIKLIESEEELKIDFNVDDYVKVGK